MTIKELKENSYKNSTKASDLIRKIAFAGIGIIWIFKIGNQGNYNIPLELYQPLMFLSISLLLDFLQYFILSIIWQVIFRMNENKNSNEIKPSKFTTLVPWILYILKSIAIIYSYYMIIKFLLV